MLRKKKVEKKSIKRIQKRRTRALIQRVILTGFLSLLAIISAFFLAHKESVLSPQPVLSMSTVSDPQGLIQHALEKQRLTPKSIVRKDGAIIVTLEENQEIIMAENGDIERELASLQLITRQLTMEGKRFVRVDLRFDKPVIRE